MQLRVGKYNGANHKNCQREASAGDKYLLQASFPKS